MRTAKILLSFSLLSLFANAQLKSPPPGDNRKAMVSENIGITQVTINYDRPGVKGREGKIYGTPVVHEGFEDLGLNSGKTSPWRAGANENTTIEFSTNVKVEGQDLPAGKYGFFVAYGKETCTLIFSKNNSSWGSFFYDDKEDVLRVKVKPVTLDKSVEWLKYEFIDQTKTSATIALQWEKIMIPFKVEVDFIKTSLDAFREQLRSNKGFKWENWEQAASFCVNNNTNLTEGLKWSENAVLFGKNFQTLSTRATLFEMLNKPLSADSCMKEAMPMGNMNELHQYGRQLLNRKKTKEALEVFKTNAQRNPKQFTTYVGLARGYSANGDYKTALTNVKAALPLAPNAVNKNAVEEMVKKLEAGKDIN